MSGVELIVAALTAGATAGLTGATSAAIGDTYNGLKRLLASRLVGRAAVTQALEADETEPDVWQARLGPALADSGVDRDDEILTAARAVLEAVDRHRHGHTTNITTNYGAAGTFTAPVTITNHAFPPTPPAAS